MEDGIISGSPLRALGTHFVFVLFTPLRVPLFLSEGGEGQPGFGWRFFDVICLVGGGEYVCADKTSSVAAMLAGAKRKGFEKTRRCKPHLHSERGSVPLDATHTSKKDLNPSTPLTQA